MAKHKKTMSVLGKPKKRNKISEEICKNIKFHLYKAAFEMHTKKYKNITHEIFSKINKFKYILKINTINYIQLIL